MSKGVNRVTILGRLGADPETHQFQNGGQVTNIRVATDEEWKDKQSGEKQSRTEWHRISFFGRLAEIAAQYLRKGSQVYIEGRLQTRKWQAQDGSDRYSTEIIAREMQMIGSRGESGGAPRQQASAPYQPPAPPADFEDDIPF